MSRKDYELIARVIRGQFDSAYAYYQAQRASGLTDREWRGIENTAYALAAEFAREDLNFDAQWFLTACNVA